MTTLVVWDQFTVMWYNVMETLNAEFEQAHPGVKIERVVKTLDDLKVTLKLALTEPMDRMSPGQSLAAVIWVPWCKLTCYSR